MSSHRLIRGITNQYSQNRAKIPNDFKQERKMQERKMQPPLKQQSQNQKSQKMRGTKDFKYDLEIEESGNYILQTWLSGFPKTKNNNKSD